MKFYRDILDGPIYIVAVVISIILIMAIIGFIMERKSLAKAEASKVAHVGEDVTPIPSVEVKKETPVETTNIQETIEAKPVSKEVIDFTPPAEDNSSTKKVAKK